MPARPARLAAGARRRVAPWSRPSDCPRLAVASLGHDTAAAPGRGVVRSRPATAGTRCPLHLLVGRLDAVAGLRRPRPTLADAALRAAANLRPAVTAIAAKVASTKDVDATQAATPAGSDVASAFWEDPPHIPKARRCRAHPVGQRFCRPARLVAGDGARAEDRPRPAVDPRPGRGVRRGARGRSRPQQGQVSRSPRPGGRRQRGARPLGRLAGDGGQPDPAALAPAAALRARGPGRCRFPCGGPATPARWCRRAGEAAIPRCRRSAPRRGPASVTARLRLFRPAP